MRLLPANRELRTADQTRPAAKRVTKLRIPLQRLKGRGWGGAAGRRPPGRGVHRYASEYVVRARLEP